MTYYEILEINEKASEEVIKMAYKALILKYHPDSYKGDKKYAEEMTKKINMAYEILSDKDKRTKYDEELNGKQNVEENTKQENRKNDFSDKKREIYLTDTQISILVSVIAICIILFFGAISRINKEVDNGRSWSKSYDITKSYGKIDKAIKCSNGYIYQIHSNEYWYVMGQKATGNLTILTDGKGKYITKEGKEQAYKIEKSSQSRIKGTFTGFALRDGIYAGDRDGKGWFVLENGQIWSQSDVYSYTRILENPKVTIYYLNSNDYRSEYYLCVDDINMAVQVNYKGTTY